MRGKWDRPWSVQEGERKEDVYVCIIDHNPCGSIHPFCCAVCGLNMHVRVLACIHVRALLHEYLPKCFPMRVSQPCCFGACMYAPLVVVVNISECLCVSKCLVWLPLTLPHAKEVQCED